MKRLVFAFGLMSLMGMNAFADDGHHERRPDPAKIAAFEAACAADKQQFCAEAQGPHEFMHCLIENETQLQAACQQKIEEFKAERAQHRAARQAAMSAAALRNQD